MAKESSRLLRLAREKFSERLLSPAEELLFRGVEAGEVVSGFTGDKDNPADAQNWGTDRVIQAECVAWLCTDNEASQFVTHLGLRISGMRFDGILDARHVKIGFPIRILKSAFTEILALTNAELPFLSLEGCNVRDLTADGIHVRGSIFLRGGFTSNGEVRIPGAMIDGNLELDGAQLLNAKGRTLNAQGATIHGSMFLRNGFTSQGEARLLGITVDGSFSCTGARFSNPGGVALSAERAVLSGGVFLNDGFHSEGEVRFSGADIHGSLDCGNARFSSPNGRAFHADRMKVQDDVFFRKTNIDGELRLVGVTVGGNFECDEASCLRPGGKALVLNGSSIGGNVFLRGGLRVVGEMDLVAATIDGHLVIRDFADVARTSLNLTAGSAASLDDSKNAWPESGRLLLDGFRYDRFVPESPVDAFSRIDWLHRQPKDRPWPQPYEQLAKVFREMGQDRDARHVMIEKNHEQARFTKRFRQGWWWYNAFGRAIGYGYAPWRALAASIVFIVVGSLFFGAGLAEDLIVPTKESAYEKDLRSGQLVLVNGKRKIAGDYPAFNPFVYSLESFIPFLKLDQKDNWLPNSNNGSTVYFWRWSTTTGDLLCDYLWFHTIMGWLLTTLWVGAVTGLIKT